MKQFIFILKIIIISASIFFLIVTFFYFMEAQKALNHIKYVVDNKLYLKGERSIHEEYIMSLNDAVASHHNFMFIFIYSLSLFLLVALYIYLIRKYNDNKIL